MEAFPATPSLAYTTLWMVFGTGLAVFASALIYMYVLRSKPRIKPTLDLPASNPQSSHSAPAVNAATAKKYIERLQHLIDSPNPPATQNIYAALSFIIRQFVDGKHGTHTINMSNEEVRHLAIDPALSSIIDECYTVEFSPNHGSIEQCKVLLKKAVAYIG